MKSGIWATIALSDSSCRGALSGSPVGPQAPMSDMTAGMDYSVFWRSVAAYGGFVFEIGAAKLVDRNFLFSPKLVAFSAARGPNLA